MALIISEAETMNLIDMDTALAAVKRVMEEYVQGSAINIPRQRLHAPLISQQVLQGYIQNSGIMGIKIYNVNQGGARFQTLLYSSQTGQLLAIIESLQLGLIRTAAASGIATQAMSRPDATIHGVFGTGRLAESHIDAINRVRPTKLVKVFARNRDRLEAFCERVSKKLALDIQPCLTPEETVKGSHIVTTLTNSAVPVFDGACIEPGTHINAVGSNALNRREIDETSLTRCALIAVDSRAVAMREAGDIMPLVEAGKIRWDQLVQLGDILTGSIRARQSDEDITCFESLGMGIQDLAVAKIVYENAGKSGIGGRISVGQ